MHDPMGMPHELVERGRFEHYLILAAKGMAVSGGIIFVALIAMSLVSIIGRKLGFGSVNGDIELMQAGCAMAATSFLPYCTLLGEHIKVDFFTENMRPRLKGRIDGAADLLMGVIAAVLAWRSTLAAIDIYQAGETTALVLLPVWIPMAFLVPGLALMAVCAFYRAYAGFHPDKTLPEVAAK